MWQMANQRARQLRKNETIAERLLWQELRKLRAQGYHFRRQCPIDGYIVDFACLAQRLIIEVDGFQHFEGEVMKADLSRDAHLRWQGFNILRFANADVKNYRDGVILQVLAALGAVAKVEWSRYHLFPNHPPTPIPSPRGGGD